MNINNKVKYNMILVVAMMVFAFTVSFPIILLLAIYAFIRYKIVEVENEKSVKKNRQII